MQLRRGMRAQAQDLEMLISQFVLPAMPSASVAAVKERWSAPRLAAVPAGLRAIA